MIWCASNALANVHMVVFRKILWVGEMWSGVFCQRPRVRMGPRDAVVFQALALHYSPNESWRKDRKSNGRERNSQDVEVVRSTSGRKDSELVRRKRENLDSSDPCQGWQGEWVREEGEASPSPGTITETFDVPMRRDDNGVLGVSPGVESPPPRNRKGRHAAPQLECPLGYEPPSRRAGGKQRAKRRKGYIWNNDSVCSCT